MGVCQKTKESKVSILRTTDFRNFKNMYTQKVYHSLRKKKKKPFLLMNCPGETKRSQAGPLEAKCIIGTLEKRSRKEVAIPLPIPKSLDSLPPSHRMFPIPLSSYK